MNVWMNVYLQKLRPYEAIHKLSRSALQLESLMFATMKLWGISRVFDHRILKRIRHSVIVYVHRFQIQCIRIVFYYLFAKDVKNKEISVDGHHSSLWSVHRTYARFSSKVPLMCVSQEIQQK